MLSFALFTSLAFSRHSSTSRVLPGGGGAGHVDTLLDPGFCCSFKVVLGGLIPYLNLCSIALISTKDLQVVVDRDADLAGHAHEHEVAVPVKARIHSRLVPVRREGCDGLSRCSLKCDMRHFV